MAEPADAPPPAAAPPTRRPGWAPVRRALLRAAAVVVVVLVVLEVGVRAISAHLPAPDTDDSQELVLKSDQIDALAAGDGGALDVVVLGSSAMDAGVEPAAFVAASATVDSAYNASLVGTPLATQARWAEDVVLAGLDPAAALVGVSPIEVLENDLADSIAPVEVIFENNFREIEPGPLPAFERRADEVSYLFRYRGALRRPSFVADAVGDTLTGADDLPRASRPEGYWEDNVDGDGAVLQYRDRSLGQVSDELVRYLGESVASTYDPTRLEALLDLLEDDGVAPVVVVPPLALTELASAGLDRDAYLDAVARLGDTVRSRGLPFLDFTTAYGRDLFADPIHLNAAGTARFSADLAAAVDGLCGTDPGALGGLCG